MDNLDPKSQKFIEWGMQRMSENYGYVNMVDGVIDNLRAWYNQYGSKEFRALLQAKMINGAKEHGEPKTKVEDIQKEINDEAIDLIGWSLMLEYAKEKKG